MDKNQDDILYKGHWVIGMIEDKSEDLRLEICPDIIRSAEVLVPHIQKHVEVGTTIYTDFWKAYDCLCKAWVQTLKKAITQIVISLLWLKMGLIHKELSPSVEQ
ncbi:unnamed protein product [Pieris macdunnoughi]|uniref:ISXO2-like transposase domain-containing protein n=1 Tax=Pieris macdunnoughi TaxID=345717 RepID=A0A821KYR2_9NEOP|nr:unnamed protein product [Pieris macdunnoughi]